MYQDTLSIDGSKKPLTYWNEFSRGATRMAGGLSMDVGNAAERLTFSVQGREGQGRILFASFSYLTSGCKEDKAILFLEAHSERTSCNKRNFC